MYCFNRRKGMKYDIVIIGSGLGGLQCAYILSQEGYKVCVVEKNRIMGGCLQTFRDAAVYLIQACIISVAWIKATCCINFSAILI